MDCTYIAYSDFYLYVNTNNELIKVENETKTILHLNVKSITELKVYGRTYWRYIILFENGNVLIEEKIKNGILFDTPSLIEFFNKARNVKWIFCNTSIFNYNAYATCDGSLHEYLYDKEYTEEVVLNAYKVEVSDKFVHYDHSTGTIKIYCTNSKLVIKDIKIYKDDITIVKKYTIPDIKIETIGNYI